MISNENEIELVVVGPEKLWLMELLIFLSQKI